MYCTPENTLYCDCNSGEKCGSLFDSDMNLKKVDSSQQMLYNVFHLFLTRNHSVEGLCVNFFSRCV